MKKMLSRVDVGAGLPGPKNFKMSIVAVTVSKGQILKNEKRPNKGQIFLKNLLKIQDSKLEFRKILKFCLYFEKWALKYVYFFIQHPKNGQMVKSSYFWQTVTNNAKMAT